MNWLDWVLVIFLVVSIANGLREGFVRMGIGFAAMIIGFFAASWFGGMVAGSLQPYINSKALAGIVAFLLVFFGVLIAGALIAALLVKVLKIVGLSWADRLLGGAFGVVRGFVVLVVITMVITAFVPKSLPRAVEHSQLAPYVFAASRVLTAATPYEIREGFDRAYSDLRGLWEEAVNRKKTTKIPVRSE
ncbi:MAG TPA: CvpA family protein [Bryobacteraceae bacterium]|nr:CvpA family protein [Bryobacteraceae bacterium]